MSTEEKMTIDERYKYFRMMKKRYERANRQETGRILNEKEVFTGQHHNGLIRSIKGSLVRQRHAKRRGRTMALPSMMPWGSWPRLWIMSVPRKQQLDQTIQATSVEKDCETGLTVSD